MRVVPIKINTNELCNYGCSRIAKYTWIKSGKLCCEYNSAKCPKVKEKIGQKNKDIRNKIDAITGLSYAQLVTERIRAAAKKAGLPDPYELGIQKMVQTRKVRGSYITAAVKANTTKQKKDSNGVSIQDIATQQMLQTRTLIDANGISNYENAARKATITKLTTIDEKGRNIFDNMWIKCGQAKPYFTNSVGLYYRSKNEKTWLDKLCENHGNDWVRLNVKNGKSIPYTFNGKLHHYMPDFVIGNKLYEIKSKYTWDNFGKDLTLRNRNVAKLNAAVSAGYVVYLVIDSEQEWK